MESTSTRYRQGRPRPATGSPRRALRARSANEWNQPVRAPGSGARGGHQGAPAELGQVFTIPCLADPVDDPHHTAKDKCRKKEMQVERANQHQPGSHQQPPNQARSDDELADRAGKPGEDSVRSEEKQMPGVA